MCSFKLCLQTVEVNGLCVDPLENIQVMPSNDRNKHGGRATLDTEQRHMRSRILIPKSDK